MNRFTPCGLLTLCLLASGIGQALAHSTGEHAGHDMPAKSASSESAQVKFADVALVDQNGQSVRLEKDLVTDKIVVMNNGHIEQIARVGSSLPRDSRVNATGTAKAMKPYQFHAG